MESRICMIGCGKMGQAMLSGWLGSDSGLIADDVCIVEHSAEKCASLHEAYGVAAFDSLNEAYAQTGPCRTYLLAVKPQVMPQVLEELALLLQSAKTSGSGPSQAQPSGIATSASLQASGDVPSAPLVISIAAGVTTQKISEALPAGVRIIRVMPNTPLQVGAGATVVAAGPHATPDDVAKVCGMFAQLGIAEAVDEDMIDAVCALSGGGPAYTALMIEALTSAGAAQGLSPELAQRLAMQTVCGTCKLMEETGASPEQTRVAVCSPGGTTLAALAAMEGSQQQKGADAEAGSVPAPAGFTESVHRGIAAAVARAKELASC